MSRSKWKGPYINSNFLKKKSLIMSRDSEIVPKFIGLTFTIHNGKTYIDLNVTENMVGHKFGEFSFTRANFVFKKKIKKK